MSDLPSVSVIIPCYNESNFISQCLESVLSNDYPKSKLEIIVVDGMSEDGTREIIKSYEERYSFIDLVDNPMRITPTGLNLGISAAKGEIIVRLDAHAMYSDDYISKCVRNLIEYNADNVGGSLITAPRDESNIGRSLALAFSHPFGSGNAYYKTGQVTEPRWVDTVPFGCYRKELFATTGRFDERLVRSQDMEFNRRLVRAGGRILLVPEIVSTYYVRSDIKDFFTHNFNDGVWAIYPYRFVRQPGSLRHLAPLVFMSSAIALLLLSIFSRVSRFILALLLGVYSLLNLYYSFMLSIKEKNTALLPLCFISFLIRHVGYGLGSLYALPRTLMSYGFWKNRLTLKNLDGGKVKPILRKTDIE